MTLSSFISLVSEQVGFVAVFLSPLVCNQLVFLDPIASLPSHLIIIIIFLSFCLLLLPNKQSFSLHISRRPSTLTVKIRTLSPFKSQSQLQIQTRPFNIHFCQDTPRNLKKPDPKAYLPLISTLRNAKKLQGTSRSLIPQYSRSRNLNFTLIPSPNETLILFINFHQIPLIFAPNYATNQSIPIPNS